MGLFNKLFGGYDVPKEEVIPAPEYDPKDGNILHLELAHESSLESRHYDTLYGFPTPWHYCS